MESKNISILVIGFCLSITLAVIAGLFTSHIIRAEKKQLAELNQLNIRKMYDDKSATYSIKIHTFGNDFQDFLDFYNKNIPLLIKTRGKDWGQAIKIIDPDTGRITLILVINHTT